MSESFIPGIHNPHDRTLAPSRLSTPVQYGIMAIFQVIVVVFVLFSLTDHWRRATFALGCGLLWLSAARVLCDSAILGVCAVRSRRFDAAFSGIIGAMMMFLAVSVDALGS